jgi:AraC-like DNA-binding protein
MGEQYLLASIAVVVIGGTSVAGGSGNIPGIWGAALFLFLVAFVLATAVALVTALIAGAPTGTDTNGDLLGRAARMLATTDVGTSAKRLHVSERHLRNLFVDAVGMPPKRFARIDRVRTILEQGTSRPWSELALAAGYYDHSHMTAEFRTLMGVPPTQYFSGQVSPNIRCQGPFASAELPAAA